MRRRAWLPPHDQSEPRFSWMVCGARQRSRPFINYVTLHMNIVRHYVTAQYSIVRARYRLQSLAFALHVLFNSNMLFTLGLGERGVADWPCGCEKRQESARASPTHIARLRIVSVRQIAPFFPPRTGLWSLEDSQQARHAKRCGLCSLIRRPPCKAVRSEIYL